jgi:hypothetical protein
MMAALYGFNGAKLEVSSNGDEEGNLVHVHDVYHNSHGLILLQDAGRYLLVLRIHSVTRLTDCFTFLRP